MEHHSDALAAEIIVPMDLSERALENAQAASTDSARLLEELEELEPAEDPFDLLEASAAIAAGAGGDDGGGGFVQLLRINESTDSNASLDLGMARVASASDGDLTRFSNAPPPRNNWRCRCRDEHPANAAIQCLQHARGHPHHRGQRARQSDQRQRRPHHRDAVFGKRSNLRSGGYG